MWIAGLVCLAMLAGAASPVTAAERLLDGIAAQVGNDIVMISDVDELAGPIEQRLLRAGAPPSEIASMRAEALDRLIDAKIVAEVVRRLEMNASDAEVENAIRSIAEDTGITVSQLARSVQSHGLTLTEYREKIRDEIERTKVVNVMVRSRVFVEDDELRALYESRYSDQRSGGREVHVRHILVGQGADYLRSAASACRIASDGLARVTAGELDFATLAAEISDTQQRGFGGDLGWLHEADLASWMANALRGMDPGDLSPVIELPFGCNLLQLVQRRSFEAVSFEQAAPALENELFQQKTEAEYARWIDELRGQVYIERKGTFAEASRLLRGLDAPTRGAR